MPTQFSPPNASPVVVYGIAVLALLVAATAVFAARRAGGAQGRGRRGGLALLLIGAWMAFTYTLAARGVLARFYAVPPPFAVVVAGGVVMMVALALSPFGRRLALGVPLAALVGFQAFRLPLELVLHRAATEGVMPVQMSFAGRNFDIVSGTTALLLGLWLAFGTVPRAVVWLWNALGAALLVNIVTIAIVSLPAIHAFGAAPERLNTWVAFPPFIWLPAVLVMAALLGHLLVARRLLAKS